MRADPGRSLKELVFGRHRGGPPPVQALRDVSLHVEPGETRRRSSGATARARRRRCACSPGSCRSTAGACEVGGRVVAQLELGAGFGRAFTGRENVFLNAALHGLTQAEVEERLDDILAFAELGEFADLPVATYSQGMFLRLGFAIAAHLDPDVLLIDEVLAVGDEAFQRKCEERIAEQIAGGATLVLVSHDAALVERTCERVVVLDHGARACSTARPPRGSRSTAREALVA